MAVTFALTEDGRGITSKEAPSGQKYTCPTCGCKMCRKQNKETLNTWFACLSGHKHTAPECKKVELSNITRDLSLTNSIDFHNHFATMDSSSPKGRLFTGEPRTVNYDEKILPYQALKDIWENGLARSTDIPIGDGMLSDILISRRLGYTIMDNNNSLGPRAVEVSPEWCFDNYYRIRFLMFSAQNNGTENETHQRKIFDMHFSNPNDYERFKRKLFKTSKHPETGKDVYARKYRTVLLHGNWRTVAFPKCEVFCAKGSCNKGWPCTGFQIAEYIKSIQLYCPPSQKEGG